MAIVKITDRYIDIKNKKLTASSILNTFNILEDEDNNYFLNIFKNIVINPTILNNPSNVMSVNIIDPWWENLSYSFYDDEQNWWIICTTNGVLNPFEEIAEGQKINLLSKNFIPSIQRDMEVINKL